MSKGIQYKYKYKVYREGVLPDLWNHHAQNTHVVNVAPLIHCQSLKCKEPI